MAKPTSYDPRLSGLRGSAAFLIVLYHVAGFGILVGIPPLLARAFDQAVVGFWVGVPVFLMLSMVLLLRSLDANSDIKHYFKRRIKRIWPIY
ncbi:MAG: acyltransferase family protein, partial [Thaumarchaeota archaeon]|nr:acyltransferase family protein [Nitrososphaerota archaeon]